MFWPIPLLLFFILSQQIVVSTKFRPSTTNNNNGNGRGERSTTYREHFETYDIVERRRERQEEERQKQQGTKSRTRYMEFAETEFSRPSFYLPMPFLSPENNRLEVIPARTLSQLIRQHISRNRMKQLALNNSSYFRGSQSRMTELRQTPFRRWSTNSSSVLSYQEKRRQWKMGMQRKLDKVPARIITPLLLRNGGYSSFQTDKEPEKNRYFVTYSPQTRTYQVSRRPPFFYTTGQDKLPEQLEGEVPKQVKADSSSQNEGDTVETTPITVIETLTSTEESESLPSTLPSITKDSPSATEETTTTEMPPTTSSPSTLLIVLQNAQPMPNSQQSSEHHKQSVEAVKSGSNPAEPIKQILFLDDYEQMQDDDGEEFEQPENAAKIEKTEPISTMILATPEITTNPISPMTTTPPNRFLFGERNREEMERARPITQQDMFSGEREQEGNEDEKEEFMEEENEDEDMFFFKPAAGGGQSQRQQQQEKRDNDLFRIVVHEPGRKKF